MSSLGVSCAWISAHTDVTTVGDGFVISVERVEFPYIDVSVLEVWLHSHFETGAFNVELI